MRRIVTLALVVAAGGCPVTQDFGPEHGRWRLDTGPNEGWFCASGGAGCSPPAYFDPPPEEVEVRAGGVLRWAGGLEHTGTVEPACIRVPPATEQGVSRLEETFCNLVEGNVVNEDRAFVMVGWSPGTPDACTCSAHFDFVGG
jgi:hypothetical protein